MASPSDFLHRFLGGTELKTWATVEWMPVSEDNSDDVWVLFRPTDRWTGGESISLSASASTTEGAQVDSGSYAFRPESRDSEAAVPLWQPQPGVHFEATNEGNATVTVTRTEADGGSRAFHVGPEQVFAPPQRIWLPLPPGVAPGEATIYYYHPGGEASGWYPAEDVAGWLVSDSALYLDIEDIAYIGFLVRHAAIVQVRGQAE